VPRASAAAVARSAAPVAPVKEHQEICNLSERCVRYHWPLRTDSQEIARIFAGTWLAYAGMYLCRKNFSVLMPLLEFSKDQLAQLIFVYSLAYCCGQALAGTLADRAGAKRVVAGGMLMSAVCTAILSAANPFWAFAALQLVNGLAQSCGWPGLVKIAAVWFQPPRRGVLMAWWSTHLVAGGLAATIIATWFATGPWLHEFGWRRGAAGPAVLLLIVAFIFIRLV